MESMDSFVREASIRDSEYKRMQSEEIEGPIQIIKVGEDQYYGIESPLIKPSQKKFLRT